MIGPLKKLDQGALGMSDPSPVSHQQGDQAIRNTRFIRGHQKQRRICSASPAVHHLQCITCSASPAVHHLQCITYGASPEVHHLQCIGCSASPEVHHLQCIICGASPAVHHLRCITPAEHHLKCITSILDRLKFLENCLGLRKNFVWVAIMIHSFSFIPLHCYFMKTDFKKGWEKYHS